MRSASPWYSSFGAPSASRPSMSSWFRTSWILLSHVTAMPSPPQKEIPPIVLLFSPNADGLTCVPPGRLNDDHDIVLPRKYLLHRTVLAHLAYNLPRRLSRAYSLINFLPGYPAANGSLQRVRCEGNLLFSRPYQGGPKKRRCRTDIRGNTCTCGDALHVGRAEADD